MRKYARNRRSALCFDQYAANIKLLDDTYSGCCLDLISSTFVDGDFTSSGIAVLLARATRLKALKVELNAVDTIPLLMRVLGAVDMDRKIELMYDSVGDGLRQGLQELTIHDEMGPHIAKEEGECNHTYVHLLHGAFNTLRRLTVPFQQISYQVDFETLYHHETKPRNVLPRSLVSIRIVCESFPDAVDEVWLDELISNPEYFRNLREVEIQYEPTLWTTALQLCEDLSGLDLASKLVGRDLSAITLKPFFGRGEGDVTYCYNKAYNTSDTTYAPGDLMYAVRRSLDTPEEKLCEDPEIKASLGWLDEDER